jgi:catechol 2,3-dioxygenase-like lactoylglutathione lyase family enzyme
VIKPIFHVNINCSNLERSLEFYEMLGFKVEIDLTLDGDCKKNPRVGYSALASRNNMRGNCVGADG